MIIPVKCFTCGTVLADKYTYYCQRIRQQNSVQSNGQIKKVEYLTKENSEKTIQGNVLDELNLKKMCCRRHMLTHVDIE
jgi:DNA-directed RNA polymerase subunit N (RpoN/RPB10)